MRQNQSRFEPRIGTALEAALKWVTALNLEQWADTIGARTQLSEIISALIRGSALDITSFRFPTGDSAQLTGYDGQLEATGVSPYVPDGKSVWEFGTGKNFEGKADEDFNHRTSNPGTVTPADTTFVFVTPRRWAEFDQWVKDKKDKQAWKDVRVVDAVALEDWLELVPPVAARIASEILNLTPRSDAQSTAEYWLEYSARFLPPLTKDVLLAGRETQVEQFLQQLGGPPQAHRWQADSAEEVVAFAVATISKAAPDIRKYLEARTILIDSAEAGRQLRNRPTIIFIPRAGARSVEGLLAQEHVTIIAVGRDSPTPSNTTLLNRPTYYQLGEALKTMGYTDDQSMQLARRCGRSVTILARQIPSASYPRPEWEGDAVLIAAMLAGGWDATSQQDRDVVTLLAGTASYDEYEGQLLRYVLMEDPPLDREGDVWKVRAPIDALVHLGPLISRTSLERLKTVATSVFAERDPRLDLSPEERPYAGLHGVKLKHSAWIRSGLATTLLLISEFHSVTRVHVSGVDPQQYVSELVGSLPGLDSDYRVIASLHQNFSTLIEASPRPLLAALERLIEADGSKIRPIFQDTGSDLLFSSSPHTTFLWGLELIAWDPVFLRDAALILAKLVRIDPGGRLSNRPLESLREIFLPWLPNTNASLVHRLAVIDEIVHTEPEASWKLLVALLPEYHGFSSPTAKPRYREAGASEKEVVTRALVSKTYDEIITRALALTGDDPSRWIEVIKKLDSFSSEKLAQAIHMLEKFAASANEEGRTHVWSALRHEINHHRSYPSAQWAMPDNELTKLETILTHLAPTDTIAKIAWLFDDHVPEIPGVDRTTRLDAVEAVRRNAIQELVRADGIPAVLSLARKVKYPTFVANAAEVLVNNAADTEALIDAAFKAEAPPDFATILSADSERRFPEAWTRRVEAAYREGRWKAHQVITLLLRWTEGHKTWDFVSNLGPEVEKGYWHQKPVWFLPNTPEELRTAAQKLLDAGRALDTISAFHYKAEMLQTDILFAILDQGVEELNRNPSHVRGNLAFEIEEIFNELRRRSDAAPLGIAQREYTYLPILGYGEKALTIHKLMAQHPGTFVSILVDVFKSESEDAAEPTPERIARARSGYRLLSDFHFVPGCENDSIDPVALSNWVDEVRRLAAAQNRPTMADEFIGHMLAHSPSDPDGLWPHRAVRDLIERVASEKIELGIDVERFNMRGVTTRGPFEGGGQERALATQAKEWSRVAAPWPRTSALLNRIAQGWERQAQYEDQEARKDAMRFD